MDVCYKMNEYEIVYDVDQWVRERTLRTSYISRFWIDEVTGFDAANKLRQEGKEVDVWRGLSGAPCQMDVFDMEAKRGVSYTFNAVTASVPNTHVMRAIDESRDLRVLPVVVNDPNFPIIRFGLTEFAYYRPDADVWYSPREVDFVGEW